MPPLSLPQVIEQLKAFYGEPDPPDITDPWELILWENVAYLVDDERRHEAMTVLRERVGISPVQILAAPAALRNGEILRTLTAAQVQGRNSVEPIGLPDRWFFFFAPLVFGPFSGVSSTHRRS
jgi:hypothetical protein